jgi:aldose 1-epimerase
MQEIVIGNKSGDSFSVLPTNGAAISSLILNHKTVIKFPLFENNPAKGYPSALLFPFPNRVRDGKYTFEGVDYQLNRNETGRGHALHGFVSEEAFNVIDEKRNGVTLRYVYHGGVEGYPFPFEIDVTYSIVRKHTFRLSYHITNTGNNTMPCGFGWHPYFSLQDKKVGELEVSIPEHYTYEVDDSTIPFQANESGTQEVNESQSISLKNEILDNVYKIANQTGFAETKLSDSELALTIRQQVGKGLLNYIVLYTPPTRSSIAIESQTSNINAFNNEDGLVALAVGKVLKGSLDVSLEVLQPQV